jgi:hypothetical protein
MSVAGRSEKIETKLVDELFSDIRLPSKTRRRCRNLSQWGLILRSMEFFLLS